MIAKGVATLTLRNGRLLDPRRKADERVDLRIEAGLLTAIGPRLPGMAGVPDLDLAGLCVAPGFFDMHVHLREPGQTHKETVRSGTAAAVAGGFTGVACMPNTTPVLDRGAHVEQVNRAAGRACPVHPIGAITKGLEGKELAEFGELVDAGCVAFSDDGKGVQSAAMTLRALGFAKMYDRLLIQHLEDETLAAGGTMHEGLCSTRLGLKGIPAEAEAAMLARDLLLVEKSRARYHAAHVSTRASLELLRRARDKGLPVSAEACPHHLDLTDEAIGEYDTRAKVNPPLRSEEHRLALVDAVREGLVEVIATDHAPHAREEKALEFPSAPFGIAGLETALPVLLERLHRQAGMPLLDLVDRLTLGPARVLGLTVRARVEVGARADLTVFDPDRPVAVEESRLASKGKNNPWLGRTLRGAPVHVFVEGVWHARPEV